MVDLDVWNDFISGLNAELEAMASEARVVRRWREGWLLVADAAGTEIGWLPLAADARIVVAYHRLWRRLTSGDGRRA